MQEWFYAEGGEQRGPVDAVELRALFAQGQVHAASLVWSAGMSDWLPLATQFDALGIRSPALKAAAPVAPKPRAATPAPSPYAPPNAALAVHQHPHADYAGGPVVHAGFLRRWAALVVDSLVLGAALITAVVLIALPFGVFASGDTETITGMAQGIYYLLYVVAAPLYYAGMESSASQATLGKRLIGIKVVDVQGRRLTFMHALGRWVAAITGYITLYIGFLLAAFTEKKQALHDLIASTYVVDKWAYTEFPERQRTGAAGCLVIGLVLILPLMVLLGILAAIALPSYAGYMQRAKTGDALVQASTVKVAVAEFVANYERCPTSWDELGIPQPGNDIASVSVGELGARECEITLTLAAADVGSNETRQIWLTLHENQRWSCRADLPKNDLPASCR